MKVGVLCPESSYGSLMRDIIPRLVSVFKVLHAACHKFETEVSLALSRVRHSRGTLSSWKPSLLFRLRAATDWALWEHCATGMGGPRRTGHYRLEAATDRALHYKGSDIVRRG